MEYCSRMNGPVLKRIRTSCGMTLDRVSQETGISVSSLSQMEQGGRNLTLRNMFVLMELYKVDANTILEMDERNLVKVDSLDERLERLPGKQRKYLQDIFRYMIEQCENGVG